MYLYPTVVFFYSPHNIATVFPATDSYMLLKKIYQRQNMGTEHHYGRQVKSKLAASCSFVFVTTRLILVKLW